MSPNEILIHMSCTLSILSLYRIIRYDSLDGAFNIEKKILAKNPKKLKTELLFRSLYQINHLFRNSKNWSYFAKNFLRKHIIQDFLENMIAGHYLRSTEQNEYVPGPYGSALFDFLSI